MRRYACRSLLLLAVAAAPALAQEATPLAELTPREVDAYLSDTWYGLYFQGQKVGSARIVLERRDGPDGPVYASSLDFAAKIVAMGERIDMENAGERVFEGAPPYRLLRASAREASRGQVVEREVERTPDGYQVTVRSEGRERTLAVDLADYTFLDEVGSADWIRAGRPEPGATCAVASFDLDEGLVSRVTYTVDEVRRTVVDGVPTRVYRLSGVDDHSGPLGTYVADAQGDLLSAVVGGAFELRAEPEALAKDFDYSADLFVSRLVRIDVPLGETEGIERLVLEVTGEGRGGIAPGPGQAVEERDGRTYLTLSPSIPGPAASEAELARYLRATPEVPADDPRLVALAEEATAGASSDAERVERLVHFVSDYVEDAYGEDSVDVLRVVEERIGDCTEHTELFLTLARAAGIPCRRVGGVGYMGDEIEAWGGHAWNEVVLDGRWVAVDATWDQVRAGPGHLRLDSEDDRFGGMAVPGRIALRVVEVERR